jgi:hypothetical protein
MTEFDNDVPANFSSIIVDFTRDLSVTFPEYADKWNQWSRNLNDATDSADSSKYVVLFKYCLTVYPERFFDILYQNDDIFMVNSEVPTFFLPDVDFKILFNVENISENTKKTMWKYLQLLLITIMTSIKDKTNFGDSANLFEGIDESELQDKLNETIFGLSDFFKNMNEEDEDDAVESDTDKNVEENGPYDPEAAHEEFKQTINNMFKDMPSGTSMPNVDELHGHLKGLFDGKIGKLAKELADEISEDLKGFMGSETGEDIKSTKDIFKKIMKNPKKLMEILKSVGSKMADKMKNGDISQEEIMKEAGDIIGKMKDMGGADQFNDILKNLTKNMGGMGKGAKVDMNALTRMTKQNSNLERMRSKLDARKNAKVALPPPPLPAIEGVIEATDNPNNFVFHLPDEEKQEKSVAGGNVSQKKKNKKKSKK